ncbi:DNA polymerase I [Haploplasma axanthum]|uniref:DNA polymerase I n=1 Tax=Haploplasma axanthum TaxID=29552 RepID=A0A449BD69_HAPAX|nr:DNA polymerase I [Haploplasma axanthum]VEU80386.1 DNA polymerase I: 5'-3' exonuclease [Haploplasma axanthum]
MKKLILIDGNSILFRAYYATAYPGATLMQTSKGEYTNALFAFVNMFTKIVTNGEENVLVAFDTSEPTFRHLSYDEYKAGRKEMPAELAEQIPRVYEYVRLMGIKAYCKGGYEADDIIGIYATEASSKGIKVDIYSSDRDLLQLVSDNVTVNLLKKGMQEVSSYTPKTLFDEFELTHNQIIDLKSLMGDSSDNIPGVPGVGPKTATTLLKQYETLENIYEHIDDIKGKVKENLINNKELAFMSKKLVTIMTTGNLDYTLDEIKREETNYPELVSFLQKYELHSLVKQLEQPTVKVEWDYNVIETEEQLKTILKDNAAIHFEFSEENYHLADIWGIGYFDGEKSFFIDKELLKTNTLKDYLKSNKIRKQTYDFKAAKVNLLWKDLDFNNCSFDLLLAAYLIDSHYGKEEFKYIVSKFNYDDVEYDDLVYGKGAKKGLPEEKSVYQKHIVSKARAIYLLREKLITELKNENQLYLLEELEIPLSNVLAKMEFQGILVSKEELHKQKITLEERINNLTNEIITLAGKDFNIASPKQLGEVLFEDLNLPHAKKNKTGYSTNADVLLKLKNDHPIIPLIIEFRELNKLYTTYIVGLEGVIFEDGKIHTIYKQALTTTGRLSSVDPNLQNIPTRTEEGRQIRKVFVASENKYFLGSDYSQIELRILADMADVKALQEAFNNKRDIHSETAKAVFDIDGDVKSEQRRAAKAVNFGIIYGIGAWSLSEDLNITPKEAQNFIDKYLGVYPEIKKYMEDIVEFATKNGYVETLVKRRRYIPELKSTVFMQREFGKRTSLNAPIQGTAADIIKIAMIDLDKYLEQNNKESKLLLQVHDELILEVPESEIKEMEEIVPKIMSNAYDLKVKLEASCDTGKTWYDI